MSSWTDEKIEEMKRYHAEGLSCSQIAVKMGGGLSRNAIIGKLHRCGMTAPRRQPGNPQMRTTIPRAPRASPARHHPFAPPKPNLDFLNEEGPRSALDIVPLHVELLDLRQGQCKWPYGDRTPFTFCGHDAIEGMPYCRGHCRMSYSPRPRGDNRGKVA